MKCPFCSSDNTRVIDSRPADDNSSIRRRRLCDDCGKRFTTYEKVETTIWRPGLHHDHGRIQGTEGALRA